jgi:hypothetical protein
LEIHPEKTRLIEFGRCAAWEREAGNIHVSWVHALLWEELKRSSCDLAAHGDEADEGKTPSHQAGVAPEDARSSSAGRRVAETGGGRLLPIPRGARQPVGALTIPGTALSLMAAYRR